MPALRLSPADLERHRYALMVSGFTRIGDQLSAADRDELGVICGEALAAAREARARGETHPFEPAVPGYEAASSLYRWGGAALSILEHPVPLQLGDALLGPHRLNDLTVFAALPPADGVAPASTSWHRDCSVAAPGALSGHLWFWFCLHDLTEHNGAPWVVPGSHHLEPSTRPGLGPPWTVPDLDAYPSRTCLTAGAGDLVVLDARAIHTSGINRSSRPRLLLNLGLVADAHIERVRTDHWAAAPPGVRQRAGARVRRLLGADLAPRTAPVRQQT